MRVLVLAEKQKVAMPFVDAMREKGIRASYLRLLKVSLVSKHNLTLIKALEENIPKYDAVFLQARLSLTPFIEPLLEELTNQGIYVNAKPGSYFIGSNEPYKFVALASAGIKTPRTLVTGSVKNIERVSKKISYPLLAKSFLGKNVQQSIIVNNNKELASIVNSIKSNVDGFMLREFIDDCVVSCIVVGEKIFAITRKINDLCVIDLSKGISYKPTEEEKQNATRAANVCGYDIARVDMVRGRVVNVDPVINIDAFNKVCSEKIEDHIANFFADQILKVGAKKNFTDELRDLKSAFSKTIFSRFFK